MHAMMIHGKTLVKTLVNRLEILYIILIFTNYYNRTNHRFENLVQI